MFFSNSTPEMQLFDYPTLVINIMKWYYFSYEHYFSLIDQKKILIFCCFFFPWEGE